MIASSLLLALLSGHATTPASATVNPSHAPPATSPAAPTGANDGGPQAYVSIGTYSDIFERGIGVPIFIEDGTTGGSLLFTDVNGQTEFVPASLGATLVVTLGETPTSKGQLLGQQRVVTMPWSPTPSDKTYLLHETTQPLAIPFVWPPSDGGDSVTADPYHSRWTLRQVIHSPKSIAFSGLAAPLLTRREIDSVLSYNGAPETKDASDFRVGTLLRTDFVKVSPGAFTLEVDCRGHGFSTPPVASCIILASGDQVTSPTLSAQVVNWQNEIAYVWLDGALEAGDNLILLSPGPFGDPTARYNANPPYFGYAIAAAGRDCVPDPPEPPADWICDAESPKSDPDCPVAYNVGIWCDHDTKRVSRITCGSPGSSESVTTGAQKGLSLSVKFKIRGVEINPTGSYVDIDSTTSTIGFGAGENGCGECKAKYRHHLLCTEVWDVYKRKSWFDWSELTWRSYCESQRVYSDCVDQMDSESFPCSRTCK